MIKLNEITVDIDTDYDEFYHSNSFDTIRTRIKDQMCAVVGAWIRRSSNNHVHIKVTFSRDLDMLEIFCARAFLEDDNARLACDLDRLYRTKDIEKTGRCFDEKYTRGKIKRAGEWMRFV